MPNLAQFAAQHGIPVLPGGGYDTNALAQAGWSNAPGNTAATPTLQTGTAQSNLESVPDIGQLTQLLDQINQGAQTSANGARIPNNPALEAQSSANIGAELGGQLDPGTLALLQQTSAESGLGTGTSGAAFEKALGLTSEGQTQLGQSNLTAADARNPGAPIVDPSQYTVTPTVAGQLNLSAEQLALQAARLGGGAGGNTGGGGGGTTPPPTADPQRDAFQRWLDSLTVPDPSAAATGSPAGQTFSGNPAAPDYTGSAAPINSLNPGNWGSSLPFDPTNPATWGAPPETGVGTVLDPNYDAMAALADLGGG